MTKVVYQGVHGAYSEEAAEFFFNGVAVETEGRPSFEAMFDAVENGKADYAAVPIENSLHGSVHANYDLLLNRKVRIVKELKLRICHHLMAHPDQSMEDIKRVYSHPQALGQCAVFLREKMPWADRIPTYDTAGAAKDIADDKILGAAAIASDRAAERYDLKILESGIETNTMNYTRFLLIQSSEKMEVTEQSNEMKTSLVYAPKANVPGFLFKSLAAFATRDIDLFKIESRPIIESPFEYLFYVDAEGSMKDEALINATKHLEEVTSHLKVLGSYPVGQTFKG